LVVSRRSRFARFRRAIARRDIGLPVLVHRIVLGGRTHPDHRRATLAATCRQRRRFAVRQRNEVGVTPTSGRTFYITTAIDYPNGAPHIGHSLEKIAADVVARYHRLLGDDTAFCMGLDENSQHIVRAAAERGVSPQQWTDDMEVAFTRAWDALDISRDAWVRTTEERHARASIELFERARANGDIYKAKYAGWYCPNCNTYYAEGELQNGRCPNHASLTPEWLEEENYFFALSKYTDILLKHLEDHPDFITPDVWRPEMLGLLKQGLKDFSVSRQVRPGTEAWGIPVPGDPQHVLYVWFDALTTYITAIGFPDDMARFDRYWPADSQVIGKDITRFHVLYWPAMLLSAGLPLPRRIAVHGFMTLEGQRISKTTGNTIDPVDLVDEYGADPVRFYLMRDVSFAADGDFSRANLLRRHNNDLGNDLGNLLNRVVSMVGRYRDGAIPAPGEPEALEADLRATAERARADAARLLEEWDLDDALEAIWTLVRRANQYLEERKPWSLAKNPESAATLDTVLWSAAEATRIAAILLAPYVPSTADRILEQLGLGPVTDGAWNRDVAWGSAAYTSVRPSGTLFPRIEAPASEE
jgi:methionyl-tRNA synthetase